MAKGKTKKSRSKVFFEEEIIKKENADQILSTLFSEKIQNAHITPELNPNQNEHKEEGSNYSTNSIDESNINKKAKQQKKRKIKKNGEELKEPVKKKKSNSEVQYVNIEEEVNEEPENKEDGAPSNNLKKTTESKRAMKRKKHAKLVEEKKLKSELKMQQNCLNYLSKWKYSRSEWKFEKLKQIWLQQNLFDSSKLPDQFWETTLEYFGGSRGLTRDVVLKNAMKIIEEEQVEDSANDLNKNCDNEKLTRARDIVQNLQE